MKPKLFKNYLWSMFGMILIFMLCCKKDKLFEFEGGTGTFEDPFLIATPGQLNEVRHNLNKHFKQIADIDLSGFSSGEGWQPIGFENEPFAGTYEGNNYKITHLTINGSRLYGIGLFGYADGNSTIKNIGLELINVTHVRPAGGLVGINKGNITNCYATGEITVPGIQQAGGLVSWNEGNITDCHSAVNVSATWVVGGLVGVNDVNGKISNCYSTGNISATGDVSGSPGIVGGISGGNHGEISNCHSIGNILGVKDVGGIVGTNKGVLKDCYFTGNVSGIKFVGGLVGFGTDIDNCYVEGNVIGENFVGGLVGNSQGGHITNCYTTCIVSAKNEVGGLVGVTVQTNIRNSFATGDVTGENQIGGLVGLNYINSSIINCYAIGDVSGKDCVGGLVGKNGGEPGYGEGLIKNSFAIGTVTGNINLGGLVGAFLLGNIEYSYFNIETSGQNDIGKGIPKTTAEMIQESTFETWDFKDIWMIDLGVSYPYLRWQKK